MKENHFDFLDENYKRGELTVMFQNVRSLSANKENIISDHGMINVDILFFCRISYSSQ